MLASTLGSAHYLIMKTLVGNDYLWGIVDYVNRCCTRLTVIHIVVGDRNILVTEGACS